MYEFSFHFEHSNRMYFGIFFDVELFFKAFLPIDVSVYNTYYSNFTES